MSGSAWYGEPDPATMGPAAAGVWKTVRLIEAWVRWVGMVAAAAVLVLAVLTAVLVVVNKGLGITTSNAFEELKWHIFGVAWLLACGMCLQWNAHVRVDTFYARLPLRGRAVIDALALVVIAVPLVAIVGWWGIDQAWDSLQRGEGSNDAGGLDHRWIIRACIPVGFLLFGLQVVAVLGRSGLVIAGVAHSEPADTGPRDAEGAA